MVSLKDLPYEFVYLCKEPAFSTCSLSTSHISTIKPSNFTLQLNRPPRQIVRTAKPASSIYRKRGQIRLARGIRHKIRKAIARRNFEHHQNRNHVNATEDWKKKYNLLNAGQYNRPQKMSTRENMLKEFKSSVKTTSNRTLARFFRAEERR